MKKLLIAMLALVILGGIITACASGALSVKDAWARTGAAGNNSAVYFVIDNQSTSPDNLLDATCDAAMMVQVHQTTIDENGNAKMEHQEKVPVAARSKVEFKPGGYHVMLMNLKKDLKPGDTLSVTLTFEKIGQVTIEAPVREP